MEGSKTDDYLKGKTNRTPNPHMATANKAGTQRPQNKNGESEHLTHTCVRWAKRENSKQFKRSTSVFAVRIVF